MCAAKYLQQNYWLQNRRQMQRRFDLSRRVWFNLQWSIGFSYPDPKLSFHVVVWLTIWLLWRWQTDRKRMTKALVLITLTDIEFNMYELMWAWGVSWTAGVRRLMLNPRSSCSQPGPTCGQLHPFCSTRSISTSAVPTFPLTEWGNPGVGVQLPRLNWFLLDNKCFSLTHM